jgi:hypothetical protein
MSSLDELAEELTVRPIPSLSTDYTWVPAGNSLPLPKLGLTPIATDAARRFSGCCSKGNHAINAQ